MADRRPGAATLASSSVAILLILVAALTLWPNRHHEYPTHHPSSGTGLTSFSTWYQIDATSQNGDCQIKQGSTEVLWLEDRTPTPVMLVLPIPSKAGSCQFGVTVRPGTMLGKIAPKLGTSHYQNFNSGGISYGGPAETVIVGLVPGTYDITRNGVRTGYTVVMKDLESS